MSTTPDIRGVLIQVEGDRLLLPNAVVAEVLSFSTPDAVEGAPDWLLGSIRWRGWQMPLVAFARMAGIAEEQGGLGSKVVVLKALGGNPKAPYFAVLTQGFPRLVTVPREELLEQDDGEPLPDGVWKTAYMATYTCDAFLVVGTSAVVYPAAKLIPIAKRKQSAATVIEFNLTPTEASQLADVGVYGLSGQTLPKLCERLGL